LEWWGYPVLVAGGMLAGYVNTLAGSGSLITLPLLILIGLPANIANGTNRVAILLQTLVAGGKFYREGMLDTRGVLAVGLPTLMGSFAGAQIAVSMSEALMRKTIGILMIVMFFVVAFRPQRWLKGRVKSYRGNLPILQILLFFGIGVYGGFIQAGIGIFLLAGLVLGIGYDLVRGNAVKVGIVSLQTAAALVVFLKNGQVRWSIGFVLAIGTMIGAWLGARTASERGAVFVHRVLLIVIGFAALRLLGLDRLVMGVLRVLEWV